MGKKYPEFGPIPWSSNHIWNLFREDIPDLDKNMEENPEFKLVITDLVRLAVQASTELYEIEKK